MATSRLAVEQLEVLRALASRFGEAVSEKEESASPLNGAVAGFVREVDELANSWGVPVRAVRTTAADLVRPLFLRGWLLARAYKKPRGYPGDFLLMERLYQGEVALSEVKSASTLMDRTFLASPSARAVLNRRRLTLLFLQKNVLSGSATHVLSLGSGPGLELEDLAAVTDSPLKITCVDLDPMALDHVRERMESWSHVELTTLRQDVRALSMDAGTGSFDVAICAGVFDYLRDGDAVRVLDSTHERLRAGGSLMFGNFVDTRPVEDRFAMDHIMKWRLIYRNEARVKRLVEKSRFRAVAKLETEGEGINLFATCVKNHES